MNRQPNKFLVTLKVRKLTLNFFFINVTSMIETRCVETFQYYMSSHLTKYTEIPFSVKLQAIKLLERNDLR